MVQIGDAAGSLGPLLFLFWPATGPPASALDQYFEITNTSGLPIVELHAARPGSGDWDEDLLGLVRK